MRNIILVFVFILGSNVYATQIKRANITDIANGVRDTRLGPIVGLKREISGIYNNCLSHMVGDVDKPMYAFTCRIDFPMDLKAEVLMTPNPVLRFSEETCLVEANFNKEKMVLFFGNPKAPLTLDEAKLCLDKGTKSASDKMELLIFKAESSGGAP